MNVVEDGITVPSVNGDLLDNASVSCNAHGVEVSETWAGHVDVPIRMHIYVAEDVGDAIVRFMGGVF